MLYPVILAGGLGKRLWPVSRKNHPKQFKALIGRETLLEQTYKRLLLGFDRKNIFIETNINLVASIKKHLKIAQRQLLVEPEAKGTAMAIAFCAACLLKHDPKAEIAVINSDHYVADAVAYIRTLKKAVKLLSKFRDKMLIVGVRPTYPETGYGYLKLGSKTKVAGVFQIKSFTEKPDISTATRFVKSGHYLWNTGIFIFQARQLMLWYQKYLPVIYRALDNLCRQKVLTFKDQQKFLSQAYGQVPNISIDYGLLEKMTDIVVMPVDLVWSDIGNWRSLRDIQQVSQQDTVANTRHVSLDSRNNLLYSFSNKPIAVFGVKDLVLVETKEVILLCHSSRAQDLRKLLEKLEGTDLEYLL